MISIPQMILLATQNSLSTQILDRIPEPDQIMSAKQNVEQFDEIINTNIMISFCGALELLFEIEALPCAGKALDLACGPGHFSLFLAKYGCAEKVIGVDLSEPMLEKAQKNAAKMGLTHRVEFVLGDVTNLNQFESQQFDLITCTNSAHHLPTLESLRKMLYEMERLVTVQGTNFVMDLTRLKTTGCVERYIGLMGEEYLSHGLEKLYEDFHNSMYAAWAPAELCSVIPSGHTHQWNYFSMFPLPINQFLFAKPKLWKPHRKKDTFQWPDSAPPVRSDLQADYKSYRRATFASYRWFLKNLDNLSPKRTD